MYWSKSVLDWIWFVAENKNMTVPQFLAQFDQLSTAENTYKKLWEQGKLPSAPLQFDPESNSITDINLEEKDYFSPAHVCYCRIEKHTNYLPAYIHRHEFLEIEVVLRGSCIQELEGRKFKMADGDVLWISPRHYHALSVFDDQAVVMNVLIPTWTFDELFQGDWEGKQGLFFSSLVKDSSIAGLLLHLGQNLFQNIVDLAVEGPASRALGHALILAFIARVSLYGQEHVELIGDDERRNSRMSAILHYINSNPDKVSLKTLSYAFNLTSAYMSDLIHRSTGSTFRELLTRKKLSMVESFLLNRPDMKLSEIAKAVGYESVQQLGRVFKKNYHMTPIEFRTLHKGHEKTEPTSAS